MFLSLEQIKSVTFGVCDVWEENGQIKLDLSSPDETKQKQEKLK